ncbi:hypothetical protein BGX38DRAFT_570612 [Terfezia claveryi]|nr:hypothetical protein BGX38DRAFT_612032 [Terfezia claveryi]KAF8458474.1 hypothetical protein BGX38DRAFT_570612 [Terfezia claveryi]
MPMPPADVPSKAEFETIHYTITAHGTPREAKDSEKKKKRSHKHRRRHRNTRDSNEAENEGIETGLHAHMTPGPPHASTATSNVPLIMPVSQQHAQTAAMHITESSAASKERAAPRAITSKQGTKLTPAGNQLQQNLCHGYLYSFQPSLHRHSRTLDQALPVTKCQI